MSARAAGSFDVTMNRQPPYDTLDGVSLARMSVAKQFRGDLDATSNVEMLAAGTNVQGSAGYVAIERVVGTLNGRAGSFVLQHIGTMARGEGSGSMTIAIIDGQHRYTFDYTIMVSQS